MREPGVHRTLVVALLVALTPLRAQGADRDGSALLGVEIVSGHVVRERTGTSARATEHGQANRPNGDRVRAPRVARDARERVDAARERERERDTRGASFSSRRA